MMTDGCSATAENRAGAVVVGPRRCREVVSAWDGVRVAAWFENWEEALASRLDPPPDLVIVDPRTLAPRVPRALARAAVEAWRCATIGLAPRIDAPAFRALADIRADGTLAPGADPGEVRAVIAAALRSRADGADGEAPDGVLGEVPFWIGELMSHLPIVVAIKDARRRYLYVNEHYTRVFGLARDRVLGRTLDEVFPAAIVRPLMEREAAVLAGADVGPTEDEFQTGGGVRTLLSLRYPIRTPSGRIIGVGNIASDITEQVDARHHLQDALLRAELANRAKSEFLANMSHELRTPLNAVLGFSEMIALGLHGPVGHPKYTEYLGDIREAGNLLLALINDILDLSRVEAGATRLEDDEVAPAALIAAVARLLKERAARANVAIARDIAPGLPALRADELRLRQVLVNLAANALKFTDPGGRVVLGCRRGSDGGIEFFVADNGIGMTGDEIEVALRAFGQVESAHRRGRAGAGLGLPIARSLVELHGGAMTIASAPGRGTTVTVHLPPARVVPAAP